MTFKDHFLMGAASFLMALLLFVQRVQGQDSIDFSQLDVKLRSMITNKAISDDTLLESISRLGRSTEGAMFWTRIANDPSYSIRHRTRAVFALFRRYGETCGGTADLARTLASATWLNECKIETITNMFGWLPVEVNPGETVFQISIFHGPSIYIRLKGDFDYIRLQADDGDTVGRFPRSKNPVKSDASILQYGYDDGYEKWLKGATR